MRVTLKTRCPAICVELWEVELPDSAAGFSDAELTDLAFEKMNAGEAELTSETCEDEHDREPGGLYR